MTAVGVEPLVLAAFIAVAFVAFLVSSVLGIGGALVLMPALMWKLPPTAPPSPAS